MSNETQQGPPYPQNHFPQSNHVRTIEELARLSPPDITFATDSKTPGLKEPEAEPETQPGKWQRIKTVLRRPFAKTVAIEPVVEQTPQIDETIGSIDHDLEKISHVAPQEIDEKPEETIDLTDKTEPSSTEDASIIDTTETETLHASEPEPEVVPEAVLQVVKTQPAKQPDAPEPVEEPKPSARKAPAKAAAKKSVKPTGKVYELDGFKYRYVPAASEADAYRVQLIRFRRGQINQLPAFSSRPSFNAISVWRSVLLEAGTWERQPKNAEIREAAVNDYLIKTFRTASPRPMTTEEIIDDPIGYLSESLKR